jgi:cytidine deaminase
MEKLLQKACDMRQYAHVPHSNFRVGAALLTDNGTIIGGCNIESDSYGLTICAERNAIFSAYAQGYRTFKALSVVTNSKSTPCGACRQIIAELCGNIPVYISDLANEVTIFQAYDLLPHHFSLTKNLVTNDTAHHEQTL